MSCLCVVDSDGLLDYCCDQHRMGMWQNERGMRDMLDQELDDVVRELAGRSPTRLERKPVATGNFAVTRKP